MAGVTQSKQSVPAPKKTAGTVFSSFRKTSKIASFGKSERQELGTQVELVSPIQEKLNNARLRELEFKHVFRITFSLFSAALLVWQNYEVFSFVDRAFATHQLPGLQLIFATLIAATLTETYFILRIIVNFVFSLSDYRYENSK